MIGVASDSVGYPRTDAAVGPDGDSRTDRPGRRTGDAASPDRRDRGRGRGRSSCGVNPAWVSRACCVPPRATPGPGARWYCRRRVSSPRPCCPSPGLHQLLRPLMSRVGTLPAVQHRALLTAFGAADGPPPELFLTALATLTLIVDAAAAQPVVLVVDDVQWLDAPTNDVLAFASRRIRHDPVVMISGLRDGHAVGVSSTDAPEIDLQGLSSRGGPRTTRPGGRRSHCRRSGRGSGSGVWQSSRPGRASVRMALGGSRRTGPGVGHRSADHAAGTGVRGQDRRLAPGDPGRVARRGRERRREPGRGAGRRECPGRRAGHQ